MLDAIVRFIHDNRRFALAGHASPDGDSLGSALALALALESLDKSAEVFSADPLPQAYCSLPGVERIRRASAVEGPYDGVFLLECGDLSRPKLANLDRYFVVNIDHHPKAGDYGELNWVDPSAAAAGEMIYQLIQALGVRITPQIATNLYVAILTDTGSFQFLNTTALTFQICSDLVRRGAIPGEIAEAVYMTEPESKIRLLSRVLSTLALDDSRRIAWVSLSREMLEQTGAALHETEGIVNFPLSIAGVVMVAFFREEDESRYRVSLRSKGHLDVGEVATGFGGGGHRNAAGLVLQGNFQEVRDRVMSALARKLS